LTGRVLLIVFAAAAAAGCVRHPVAHVPLAPSEAQRTLEGFAQALGDWDVRRIESLIVGGAAHPAWKIQHASLEGRGIRFRNVQAGVAREIQPKVAVGLIRFQLVGASVDDKTRVSRVALLERPEGWRVSFWGTRFAVKRHLRWVLRRGDPLLDPSFRILTR
jgi:hypothetical protein